MLFLSGLSGQGPKRELQSYAGLAIWLLLSFAAGWFGSQFEPGPWYAQLKKPGWTPPSSVFPPVWTALYVMMAVAAWLVWRRQGFRGAPAALSLYLLQLALNAGWSWLFFGLQWPGVAAVELALLWLVLGMTVVGFYRHSAAAGLLLVPYLLWAGYAAILNFRIWQYN